MKLFYGKQRSDYEEVLRAIGALIDERGYMDVRIIETEDGMVIQGRNESRNGPGTTGYETYLVTEEDITAMIQSAYQRRNETLSA